MRIDGALGLLSASRQSFRSRWLIRAVICLSAAFHGIVIFVLVAHIRPKPAVDAGGLLTVIPVDLVAPPNGTLHSDAVPQQESTASPLSTPVSEPPNQSAPQFEMHMFSTAPAEVSIDEPAPAASKPSNETRDQRHETVSEKTGSRPATDGGSAKLVSNPDAIRNQIARCWRLLPQDQKTPITISLVLTIAGAIEEPPQTIVPTGEWASPSTLQAVRHAIYTCAPYKLPADSFNEWHRITFSLDSTSIQEADMGQ